MAADLEKKKRLGACSLLLTRDRWLVYLLVVLVGDDDNNFEKEMALWVTMNEISTSCNVCI